VVEEDDALPVGSSNFEDPLDALLLLKLLFGCVVLEIAGAEALLRLPVEAIGRALLTEAVGVSCSGEFSNFVQYFLFSFSAAAIFVLVLW